MVICFDCPDDKKREIDRLIAAGRFASYSEFICLAIANQLLLDTQVGMSHQGLVVEPSASRGHGGADNARQRAASKVSPSSAEDVALFAIPNATSEVPRLAPMPDDVFAAGESVSIDRWIFGQFNRLLPAKASCRALANLLLKEPSGVDLGAVSVQIARAARVLGTDLARRDGEGSLDRDDHLAVAFPLPDSAEKGIARFSNQFVGSTTNRGQLSGLLASLRLVGRINGKQRPTISLTDAGWKLAVLRNPCIDEDSTEKFTEEERQFLCRHILENVPQEASAFRTIIELTNAGHDTPTKLDKALAKNIQRRADISPAFVATQRSGVISRMTDLNLVDRRRDGTRVTYVITPAGDDFGRQVDK